MNLLFQRKKKKGKTKACVQLHFWLLQETCWFSLHCRMGLHTKYNFCRFSYSKSCYFKENLAAHLHAGTEVSPKKGLITSRSQQKTSHCQKWCCIVSVVQSWVKFKGRAIPRHPQCRHVGSSWQLRWWVINSPSIVWGPDYSFVLCWKHYLWELGHFNLAVLPLY